MSQGFGAGLGTYDHEPMTGRPSRRHHGAQMVLHCVVKAAVKEVPGLRAFPVVIERDPETGLLVGYVPGWPGAHTQGADTDELLQNLREVIEMLLEDGEPQLECEFVDVRTIQVA